MKGLFPNISWVFCRFLDRCTWRKWVHIQLFLVEQRTLCGTMPICPNNANASVTPQISRCDCFRLPVRPSFKLDQVSEIVVILTPPRLVSRWSVNSGSYGIQRLSSNRFLNIAGQWRRKLKRWWWQCCNRGHTLRGRWQGSCCHRVHIVIVFRW